MRCFQSPMAVDNDSLHHSLLLSLHQCPFCLKFPKCLPSTNYRNRRSNHSTQLLTFFLRSVGHLFDLSVNRLSLLSRMHATSEAKSHWTSPKVRCMEREERKSDQSRTNL